MNMTGCYKMDKKGYKNVTQQYFMINSFKDTLNTKLFLKLQSRNLSGKWIIFWKKTLFNVI